VFASGRREERTANIFFGQKSSCKFGWPDAFKRCHFDRIRGQKNDVSRPKDWLIFGSYSRAAIGT
jgi:hypothetical protein